MADARELVFYIHGVSPSREGRRHTAEYRALHEGIGRHMPADKEWPEKHEGAEWGWNVQGEEDPKSHQALTKAQNILGDRVFDAIGEQRDWTWNPTRLLTNALRELLFFGFGDMFYYVSADGKWSVRHEVAGQILKYVTEDQEQDLPLSITLLGHSAGSVIAFDFLYYVFSQRQHQFLHRDDDDTAAGMAKLRELASNRMLRLRRLITFGSPISLLAFRSDALVEILSRGEKLRVEDYGLTSQLEGGGELEGPRWINIWDKDDPIAWPTAQLMDSPLTEDVYVDVSEFASAAHNAYWESDVVHRTIASAW